MKLQYMCTLSWALIEQLYVLMRVSTASFFPYRDASISGVKPDCMEIQSAIQQASWVATVASLFTLCNKQSYSYVAYVQYEDILLL